MFTAEEYTEQWIAFVGDETPKRSRDPNARNIISATRQDKKIQ